MIRKNSKILLIFCILGSCLMSSIVLSNNLYLIQNAQKVDKNQKKSTSMSNKEKLDYFFEIIRTRRTVREFRDTPVPEEDIVKILDMARYAPTAGNQQTWKFVVIRDPENLKALKENMKRWLREFLHRENMKEGERESYLKSGSQQIDKVMTAPVYIIIFADTNKYGKYAIHDGCLAAENIMLTARAMGYGTGFFTSYFPEDKVKEFLHAPKSLKFICATPLGIPKEWPIMPQKKELKEFVVYENFKK